MMTRDKALEIAGSALEAAMALGGQDSSSAEDAQAVAALMTAGTELARVALLYATADAHIPDTEPLH